MLNSMGDLDSELEKLSHEDLCEITQSSLRRLIAADKLLQDLPPDVTTEEVLAQVAVAQGQSITVTVLRHSESPLHVVIPQQGTTVRDLKLGIQRSFGLKQQRQRIKTKISWKYIWRVYQLQHEGMLLKRDRDLVSEYGIVNRSELRFVKRLNDKDVSASYLRYPWLNQIVRQEILYDGCSNTRLIGNVKALNTSSLDHILVDHTHKLLYCYVPKIACTNWKRVLMVLTGMSNTSNLIDISSSLAHAENSTIRLSQLSPDEAKNCLETYTSFLVARNPLERLLSAYRNKFEGNLTSSKYFQKRYGRHIIRKYRKPKASGSEIESGSDVSLDEFVEYLLTEGTHTNEHWTPIYTLCQPCVVNYTFIGKYETLSEDAVALLDLVKAPPITFPMTNSAHTNTKLRKYYQKLPLRYLHSLYTVYKRDFRLFGYNLESILGYDFG